MPVAVKHLKHTEENQLGLHTAEILIETRRPQSAGVTVAQTGSWGR